MKLRNLLFLPIIGLLVSGCITNPNTLAGTGLGAAAGGILGQHVGQGRVKTIATIAGTILGAAMGNHVGGVFDGVSHNRNAINRNQLQLNQLRNQQQQQSQSPSPIFYQAPYSQPRQNSIPLNCSVRNNYVVCNGS